MPKRKKLPNLPDYTGIPKDNKLIVQKSNPLQTLSETKLSLAQFKILDAYLSRIDSHDEEKRYVRFEKGELEKILDVTKISKEDLQARLENLFQVVTIKDANKPNGFTIISLFEKAEAYQDENGLWQIDLACTYSALEYVFNIENLGYLRYRLKNIIDLTSRYSYILYLYLENNRFRRSWKISLEELRKILNCTAESYNKYKEFNDKILKKCQYELHEKTDLRFSYQPTDKRGRSYTAVIFTLETVADRARTLTDKIADRTDQLSFIDTQESVSLTRESEAGSADETDLILQLCRACNYDFARGDIQSAYDLAGTFVQDKGMAAYFEQTYRKLLSVEKNRKVRDRFRYFYQIICSDADKQRKEQQEMERNTGYQPTYDLDEYGSTSILDELDDEDE